MQTSCKSNTVAGIEKKYIAFMNVLFDGIGTLIIYFSLLVLGKFEEIETNEIDGDTLTGADFTLKLKNLPKHDDIHELRAKLWNHIEDVLEERGEKGAVVR